ncbi:glycoside hydrolase family 32 protein [Corynebacterium stationis]|uniref:glycoside hydrolase family 32 protein n=1 Tax=Corynebacterium stationis TaxID=1705 RepID=UPI00273C3E85|nr:glycoside hydrolase family 32 protein [Corynebacterium stationis]WLP87433.1 glycoside hydrolase family 32 protein [Corynebacterium stationis]
MTYAYRPNFHITPPFGRLNDPNGLFIEDDRLHVFYQHDPAFPDGQKRTGWGHASLSVREAQFPRHHPDALYPDADYDAHGCYSGGAVKEGDDIWLFYTGNLKVDGKRIPSQNRVRASLPNHPLGGTYRKDEANPLIPDAPAGFTGHFRDPHIVRDGKRWRMVLGAQTAAQTGAIVVYHSEDLKAWDFTGSLNLDVTQAQPGLSPDILPGGYMWECPNLISMVDHADGRRYDVLVFCPQGLAQQGEHYVSSDQSGYIVGHVEGTTFHVTRGFTELDYGFEFYAPQLLSDGDDAITIGWMGLPAQDDNPTVSAEGWVHALTLPRRTTLHGGVLKQVPLFSVPETPRTHEFGATATASCEPDETLSLVDASSTPLLSAWHEDGKLHLRRHSATGDETRSVMWPPGDITAIADGCTVEVFSEGLALSAQIFGPWEKWA